MMHESHHVMKKKAEECLSRQQALQMQLDTVTIKITETEENQKNYDLNIAHLKVRNPYCLRGR